MNRCIIIVKLKVLCPMFTEVNLLSSGSVCSELCKNSLMTRNFPKKFQESLNNRIALSIIGIGMNELCNPETDFGKLRKYIKKYISDEEYSNSYSTLKLDALPIAWKVLIFCCKKRLSFMVCLILHTIRAIK